MHKEPKINIFNFEAHTRIHKKLRPIQHSANIFTKTLCVL